MGCCWSIDGGIWESEGEQIRIQSYTWWDHFPNLCDSFMLLLFERTLHGKTYPQKEINRKFSFVMPLHLVKKIETIRERSDLRTMTLERLFGKLKTFEMELEHRKILYGGGSLEAKHTTVRTKARKRTWSQVIYRIKLSSFPQRLV